MGPELSPGHFDPEAGSLYSVDKDHSLKRRSPNYTISNGLAWSADQRTMFFIDSTPRHVYAFDFDITNGAVSKSVHLSLHEDVALRFMIHCIRL